MDLGLIDSTRAKANDREDDFEVLQTLRCQIIYGTSANNTRGLDFDKWQTQTGVMFCLQLFEW